jgi:Domain of unknown function (DUF4351)
LTSHDQLAKDLLQNFFSDFLSLAAPAEAGRLDVGHAVFVDKQMFTDWPVGERRELDLLAEVPVLDEKPRRVLIHVEIEAEASSAMAERVWKYYMQVRLRHRLLVLPILVNLRGGRPGLQVETLDEGFRPQTAQFHFQALSLSGCLAVDYLARPEPLAWAFAALMHSGEGGRARQKADCMQQIAAAHLADHREWLLANWVATYLQLTEGDAEEYQRLLRLPAYQEVRVMEMTWGEKIFEEGRSEGKIEGRSEGKIEGRSEGKIEGKVEALRQFVLRQIERRFGAVPENVRQRVEALDSTDALTEVGDKLMDSAEIRALFESEG